MFTFESLAGCVDLVPLTVPCAHVTSTATVALAAYVLVSLAVAFKVYLLALLHRRRHETAM